MKVESIILNKKRNVTLTAYIQDTEGEYRYVVKRPGILVLPGGGYQFCSDREADPVAFPYLKAGYQVFILRYSVKEDAKWPNPLDDYEQAMQTIRSNADKWKLYADKIAVIGFSAGGHLAGCAAAMSKNRPNAAILGYAVTMGETARACNPSAPDVIEAVDKNTCPCFLFATRTDNIVPIENSLKMMDALTQAGVSYESHIYAYGPHGFSTGDSSIQGKDTGLCGRALNWVEDSIGWLKDVLGDFGEEGMTKPVCNAHVTADCDDFLSVDCTIGRLLGNPEAAKILGPMLERAREENGQQGSDNMEALARKMKLRDALQYGNMPDAVIQSLDEQLSKIPNL